MAAASFEPGSWVWIADEADLVVPAKVLSRFKAGEATRVERANGAVEALDAKASRACSPCDRQCFDAAIEDLITLDDLNEHALLHTLRARYGGDAIYTRVSDVLISVNPFKVLPIYTPETLATYVRAGGRASTDLPPHCYGVSAAAHAALVEKGESQAICISGESGAGKTEAMKLMLQHLAEASGRAQSGARGDANVEQMILRSNPLTEAFGNAKTLRNNNSSRFGKWTALTLTPGGAIATGEIVEYLEKSRVAWQAEGERNYHGFYQLLAGGAHDAALAATLAGLDAFDAAAHAYTSRSSCATVPGTSDEADFEEVRASFRAVGVGGDEESMIWRVVAAVLVLGDVAFDGDDAAAVATARALADAASLFGCDAPQLQEALVAKYIGTRSVVRSTLSPAQAADARDAFAKATYARLFSWIVARVNGSLREQLGGAGAGKGLLIGVLDIFGFEYFEVNSLEQLCINYCNEKLQFFFNDYVFNKEADEYVREGVDLELVEFQNNGPTLALLEAKRTGVFAMVDEEIAVPRGSDASLLSKLKKQHGKDASYEVPSPKVPRAGSSFGVRHYAATVRYVVDGFLEKNRDALLDALVALGASSSNAVARALYADAAAASSATKAPARKKKKSLCGKFRAQLDDLVAALARCAPHFVRCIKPNAEKRPDLFTSAMVQGQMRCAGVLEVCKIRRAGFALCFAYRVSFDAFARRYGCVSGTKSAAAADLVAAFATPDASGAALLAARSYALGRTKVFLRAESRSALEDARAAALERFYVRVQSAGRRRVAAVQYARYAAIRAALREAVAARDVGRVDAALGAQDYALLPYGGEHLPELREARRLAEAFANVKAKLVALKAARDARALPKILEALEALRVEAPSPVVGDAVAEAEELVAVLEREPELEARLRDAAAAARARPRARRHADASGRSRRPSARPRRSTGRAAAACPRRRRRRPGRPGGRAARGRRARRARRGDHAATATLVAALRAQGLDREPLVDEARALLRELGRAREAAARLEGALSIAEARAAQESDMPNFKGSYLGRFPLAEATRDASALDEALADEDTAAVLALAEGAGDDDEPPAGVAVAVAHLRSALDTAGLGERHADVVAAAADALVSVEAAARSGRGAERRAHEAELEAAAAERKRRRDGAEAALLGDAAVEAGADDGGDAVAEARAAAAAARALAHALDDVAACRSAVDALERGKDPGPAAALGILGDDDDVDGDGLEAVAKRLARAGKALRADAPPALTAFFGDAVERAKRRGARRGAARGHALEDLDRLRAAEAAAAEAGVVVDLAKTVGSELEEERDAKRALVDRAAAAEDVGASAAPLKELRPALDALDAALGACKASFGFDDTNDADCRDAKRARDRLAAAVRAVAAGEELATELRAEATALHRLRDAAERASDGDLDVSGRAAAFVELRAAVEVCEKLDAVAGGLDVAAAAARLQRLEDEDGAGAALRRAAADDDGEALEAALEAARRVAAEGGDGDAAGRSRDRAAEAALAACDRGEANASVERGRLAAAREASDARARGARDPDGRRGAAARDAGDVDGRLLEEAGALLVALEEAAATLRDAHGVDGFGLASFRKLRRPADYAEGLASAAEKQQALRRRFVHQAVPLHTSQLVLGGKALDAARACHRDILGFCGDMFMSYPEAMAENLAAHGFGGPEDLRDEIFVQLAKQASANPSASSAFKCWRLLFLCASTFPPSAELLPILVHFCEAADCQGPPGDHVRDVLDALAPARKVLEAAGGGALEPGALLVPLAPAPRPPAPLREVGGNMSDLQPLVDMGIVPIELKDVVDGAAATDEDVEAAFEQLEILEHADEVRARFDELIRAAEEAVASEDGARDYHAMDLEAQLNLVQTTKVPGLDVSQIIDAEELVARMYDQLDLQATLAAAVDARDLAGLDEGLARARDMGDAGLARCRDAAELRAKLAPSLQKRLSAFLGL
ncbi:hypothetical protein JL722_2831 [Aureococcus anophagefferens]|nr:hypothetical protein JL722_2831 [Aureococcus anophagefferens]